MQIEDILVGDKQLAKEIMYDMKQAELAKEGNASAPAQPGASTQQPNGQHPTAMAGPSTEHASATRALVAASPRAGLSPKGGTVARHRQSSLRRSSGELPCPLSRQRYKIVATCDNYKSFG